jgi:hypothetical protein
MKNKYCAKYLKFLNAVSKLFIKIFKFYKYSDLLIKIFNKNKCEHILFYDNDFMSYLFLNDLIEKNLSQMYVVAEILNFILLYSYNLYIHTH